MAQIWSCRYSSCEMMYLELGSGSVRMYLDHSPGNADVYPFARVLAGDLDAEITNLFGRGAVDEVKAAVRAAMGGGVGGSAGGAGGAGGGSGKKSRK